MSEMSQVMDMERFVDPAEFESELSVLDKMLLQHLRGDGPAPRRINSKMLLMAAMSRQQMDYLKEQGSDVSIREAQCGRYQEHHPEAPPDESILSFRRACNAIIHAKTCRYDLRRNEDQFLIFIHGTRKKTRVKKIETSTDLYGMAFLKSCKMLSSAVARHDSGAVQDVTATYAASANPAREAATVPRGVNAGEGGSGKHWRRRAWQSKAEQ